MSGNTENSYISLHSPLISYFLLSHFPLSLLLCNGFFYFFFLFISILLLSLYLLFSLSIFINFLLSFFAFPIVIPVLVFYSRRLSVLRHLSFYLFPFFFPFVFLFLRPNFCPLFVVILVFILLFPYHFHSLPRIIPFGLSRLSNILE